MIKNKIDNNAYEAQRPYGSHESYESHESHESHEPHKSYESHKPNCSFLLALLFLLLAPSVHAQITIGGNIYGGGNEGKVTGNGSVTIVNGTFTGDIYGGGNRGDLDGQTTVTLQGGDMQGAVFGGSRMADVGKSTLVNIDGQNQAHDILCSWVFGGNDISGTIGAALTAGDPVRIATPEVSAVNNTFQTYTYATKEKDADHHIYVGQLFGGGNGAYTFEQITNTEDANYGQYNVIRTSSGQTVTTIPASMLPSGATALPKPDVAKSYVQVNGGIYGYVFNGGNNATITETAAISINNSSDITSKCTLPSGIEFDLDDYTHQENISSASLDNLVDKRLLNMGLNLSTFETGNHFLRVFGGNNQEDMAIIPTWNLKKGKIRDLYSGGNKGDMTSPVGILLEIPKTSEVEVTNAYGGCRMADVHPKNANGTDITSINNHNFNVVMNGGETDHEKWTVTYGFPDNLSARILVQGGNVHNVYGGNDITGDILGGTAVGVYTSISGDVYGGGNGSYAYTDNDLLEDDIIWGDYYYNPGTSSIDALNAFRPNVEQVSLRVVGEENKKTIIGGSIYVGGNSATLLETSNPRDLVELKVGSYVICDNVYLGNNGEHMVDKDNVLARYAGMVVTDQMGGEKKGHVQKFSTLNLTDPSTFASYMKGAAMNKPPRIVFDGETPTDPNTYEDYTTYFGSVFCGGNRGSMVMEGNLTINANHKFIVYEKFVGGCNNADIPVQTSSNVITGYDAASHSPVSAASDVTVNAAYLGGFLGSDSEQPLYLDTDGTSIKNRLTLNLIGLEIQPMRWKKDAGEDDGLAKDAHGRPYLEWNTISAATGLEVDNAAAIASGSTKTADADDKDRRLKGGNIYGGCYTSGHINGNVVINLQGTILDKSQVFDQLQDDTESLYGDENYIIKKRNSGVILDLQGMDALGQALNVFGGGSGWQTEVWGSATINLEKGYAFQIFGGSERGVIGRRNRRSNLSIAADSLAYDARYSTRINLCGQIAGVPTDVTLSADDAKDLAETEFIYGGGFEGPVLGNTGIYLDNGRVYNTFAGACNADIYGHTETYVGLSGFPYVRDHIYGGNDLGGRILGELNAEASSPTAAATQALADCDFTSRISSSQPDALTKVYQYNADTNRHPAVLTASAYIEYRKGRINRIFGGCYGDYDYSDPRYDRYTYTLDGEGTTYYPDAEHADAVGNIGTARPGFTKPRMGNAFVNFRPVEEANTYNGVSTIFGAGQGHSQDSDRDIMQERSYILVDIAQENTAFSDLEVFGSGAYSGLGMGASYATSIANPDRYSAVVDLIQGTIRNAYGASFNEGITRRTVVNVPVGSTIAMQNVRHIERLEDGSDREWYTDGHIFGGGYGNNTYLPCDAYESNVNYASDSAIVKGSIFGGNNNERRTLYAHVNISAPVWSTTVGGYNGSVYGAGQGKNTWAEYTEVNLLDGARVYEVYGGGLAGKVLNARSNQHYINNKKYYDADGNLQNLTTWPAGTPKAGQAFTNRDWVIAWKLGGDYDPDPTDPKIGYDDFGGSNGGDRYYKDYHTNLSNPLARLAEMDDRDPATVPTEQRNKYNTNVIVHEGAEVGNYLYGGGYGADAVVAGTTYVALLGGTVAKDIYGSGTSGAVKDLHGNGLYDPVTRHKGYTASTNVYIKGGLVRNVYGGGWRGDVGRHDSDGGIPNGEKSYTAVSNYTYNADDIPGESHVVIGDDSSDTAYGTRIDANGDGTGWLSGIPSVTRNVYGGGEGGSVFGTTYVRINNGYIGYRYIDANGNYTPNADTGIDPRYEEEVEDKTKDYENTLLDQAGNVFGGGYVANSYCDNTIVTMYGGNVRGSLFGGGEIGPVGRGTVADDAPSGINDHTYAEGKTARIYKAGSTHVYLYKGHVMRDVFGGGRGYDNLGEEGWMDEKTEKPFMDLSSKGFVFGLTEVRIRGGEVGTRDNVVKADGTFGFGNVFGGGDVGYVFSGTGRKKGERGEALSTDNGLPVNGGGYYYYNDDISKGMTMDCRVIVEPYAQALEDIGEVPYQRYTEGIDSDGKITYPLVTETATINTGDYAPIGYLTTLKNRTSTDPNGQAAWEKLDASGVIIHNAVFAGGNVTIGSDQVYVNTGTVFGNATVCLRDVYNRDLVTIGTERIGGIYGDGNLTFVDGFREIHIDNYGTDYHYLTTDNGTITKAEYDALDFREQAYFKVSLECIQECKDKNDHTYTAGTRLSVEEFNKLFSGTPYILTDGSPNHTYWVEKGYNIYEGRILNTLQRADFCGVFGSRMVLFGARDRVPEKANYTEYTINRVGEVSLNRRTSQAGDTGSGATHGNYFGIYNIVNYLGALTSDEMFDNVRTTSSTKTTDAADGKTFFEWKNSKPQARNRNNGSSPNLVALSSGVYLEIISEETEARPDTVWGPVTGVVELDLIDVKPGMGGGYVYAKNIHGLKTWHSDWDKVTLSPFNLTARTYRRFTYDNTNLNYIETSGNFVHPDPEKEIVDDCYPRHDANGITPGEVPSPAHYWYIKGYIYVYDQYISAYTGSANAYAESVSIPLTLSASAYGKITLREVQPNLYAYYDRNGNRIGEEVAEIEANDRTYKLGDPIDYWQWNLLSTTERRMFVQDLYTVIEDFRLGDTPYKKGSIMLPSEYKDLSGEPQVQVFNSTTGQYEWTADADKDLAFLVRSVNNLGHDTGYALTFDMTNPNVWNQYYTYAGTTDAAKKRTSVRTRDYNMTDKETGDYTLTERDKYIAGPTYSPFRNGIYGQKEYSTGEIISQTIYNAYVTNCSEKLNTTYLSQEDVDNQASVEPAYVATEALTAEYTVTEGTEAVTKTETVNAGTPLYRSKYTDAQWKAIAAKVAAAKVCTSTIQLTATEYVYKGALLTPEEIGNLYTRLKELHPATAEEAAWTDDDCAEYLSHYVENAYYCTKGGLYGGNYFEEGQSYRAIDTWSTMSAADRKQFFYNYDAFDLLIDPTYTDGIYNNDVQGYGYKPQYDGYAIWKGQNVNVETASPTGSYYTFEGDDAAERQAFFDVAINNPPRYSKRQSIDYEAEFSPSHDQVTALGSHYVTVEGGTDYLTYTDENRKPQTVKVGFDNRIDSEEFEKIPNERVHWSAITVKEPRTYYIVKEPFTRGDIPYTVGEVIEFELYSQLGSNQSKVDLLDFTEKNGEGEHDYKFCKWNSEKANWDDQHYYFCRERYVIGEHGEGVGFTNLGLRRDKKSWAINDTVPEKLLIDEANFNNLVNLQTGFVIHGNVPVETSTLYVSRESDIYDLQKEKIITVVYLYEYQESDESGNNLVPMSERHIVNIHINFKTGVPEIGPLDPPATVIPGNSVGMKIPSVTPGAFEITSSGWEMFTNGDDAALHRNGTPYVNNETQLYWYQNDYWVAYYTQTYLGKTYSEPVQFSVANYHDLAKVMGANDHHYYIDHKDVDRSPKIYVNNYSADGKNGLDLLKNLYDLSHTPLTYDPETGAKRPISGGTLDGHIPLENHVSDCQNLEIILHANQDHSTQPNPAYDSSDPDETDPPTIAYPWTPIANGEGECFEGNFHGDGYTVSGLDHSLFGHLCGNVYNLGVTGTFTSAGIADEGTGYVENCWVMNTGGTDTAPVAMDATDASSHPVYPVLGNPTRDNGTQVVNCYYPLSNSYPTIANRAAGASQHARGEAMQKPLNEFYNGEVAYDLNGFYLHKRYNDHISHTAQAGETYSYWDADDLNADGSMKLKQQKYEPTDYAYMYVETDRIADGDFIYADGTVPGSSDVRYHNGSYYPIWPDDYLYFGQMLTYGWDTQRTHQPTPAHIAKDGSRLWTDNKNNRVYRAPAYFSNKKMDVVHYNPDAIFARTSKDGTREAFPGLTAIDFTGANDVRNGYQRRRIISNGYANIAGGEGAWYPPLLDDDGLRSFQNANLTQNLLVYIPQAAKSAAAAKTNDVITRYLAEPTYDDYYNDNDYRTVARYASIASISGHRIVKDDIDDTDDAYTAPVDHYLVDRQDFNAPLSYKFAAGKRMWYQRRPEDNEFVSMSSGWQGISIPFAAELVTTDTKGEITHFYSDSRNSLNGTDTKLGHEYWLREFNGNLQQAKDSEGADIANVYTADFNYPSATSVIDGLAVNKTYTNTFLWDYYYQYSDAARLDKNTDTYQQQYYRMKDGQNYVQQYANYAYLAAAKPYLIGFPGQTYYEFDLSGKWKAPYEQTYQDIAQLSKQTITFASPAGTTIEVSDDEQAESKATPKATFGDNSYTFTFTFTSNYLSGTLSADNYQLNSDGSRYEKVAATGTPATYPAAVPFRPFFTVAATGGAKDYNVVDAITFTRTDSHLGGDEEQTKPSDRLNGMLKVTGKQGRIIVTSYLCETMPVTIVNTAGIVIRSFDIEPGETIVTSVPAGVYIVNDQKISVKGR